MYTIRPNIRWGRHSVTHTHTHTPQEKTAEIAKPREMGNLSKVGKVVRPTVLWVWKPWLRLKPDSQKGGFKITPSTAV